jgi:hypothetical protein
MCFWCSGYWAALGVGISSVTAPIYISEVSPADSRGAGWFISVQRGIGHPGFVPVQLPHQPGRRSFMALDAGRTGFSIGLFLTYSFILYPKARAGSSLKKAKPAKALEILRIINPLNCEQELASIKNSTLNDTASSSSLFSGQYKTPVILAVLFAFFNQVSGINAIIYYAPRIFEMAGLGRTFFAIVYSWHWGNQFHIHPAGH